MLHIAGPETRLEFPGLIRRDHDMRTLAGIAVLKVQRLPSPRGLGLAGFGQLYTLSSHAARQVLSS